jgi:hypothetical protein
MLERAAPAPGAPSQNGHTTNARCGGWNAPASVSRYASRIRAGLSADGGEEMTDYYHLIHAQGERIAALEGRVAALEGALRAFLPAPERPPIQQSDHYLDRMLARSSDEVVKGMVAVVDDKLQTA